MKRFRIGLGVGLAAGYYLGARAGRGRYEQINRAIGRARKSRPIRKVRAGVDLVRERLRPGNEPTQLKLVPETPPTAQGSSR